MQVQDDDLIIDLDVPQPRTTSTNPTAHLLKPKPPSIHPTVPLTSFLDELSEPECDLDLLPQPASSPAQAKLKPIEEFLALSDVVDVTTPKEARPKAHWSRAQAQDGQLGKRKNAPTTPEEIIPPPYTQRHFPRYHDYNIDAKPDPTLVWEPQPLPALPPKQMNASLGFDNPNRVLGFEVSKIKVIGRAPFDRDFRLKGATTKEQENDLQKCTVRFLIERKDDKDVDVIKSDGTQKTPNTMYTILPLKRKIKTDPLRVVFVFGNGCFRFRDCIEYDIHSTVAGVKSTIAVGIVRLSDICARTSASVQVKLCNKNYFRPLERYDQYYQGYGRYKLVVPDKSNRATVCFFGRTLANWHEFMQKPIPISKTSRVRRCTAGDETDSESSGEEEEEGEVKD